ncbi:MAG: hypothetical protein KGI19_09570 [Thaumarchaeota archaeon]|nr:hypothetical protein [Nitrososphaerota archaeon]
MKITWESSVIIFEWFFAIFLGSYFAEAILTYKTGGFLDTLKDLSLKYLMLFSLEFLGVYIHAHLSFFPDSEIIRYWQNVSFIIVIGNATAIEAYYYFIFPRLKNKELSNRAKILLAIGLVIAVFVLTIHACFLSKIC